MQNVNTTLPTAEGISHYEGLKKYSGLGGKILHFFGVTVKVHDSKSDKDVYIKISDISRDLVGKNSSVNVKEKKLIDLRIQEITSPIKNKASSSEKIQQLFSQFFADKNAKPDLNVVQEMEQIKLNLSEIKPIYYNESLKEIVEHLQPGDILARKYHEDNPNIICTAQRLFSRGDFREAYKCSHICTYLGEINGEHWIAEASMPDQSDAQVRRIKIDDPRFALKEKNQYLVFRRTNTSEAAEAARLARNYSVKMLPASEAQRKPEDLEATPKYNLFEAIRSVWHSNSFDFMAKHRFFKYYSDYKNGIAFEYLGKNRGFFCSHFSMLMQSMAELNKSDKFKQFLEKHPVPTYNHEKTGLALKVSKFFYSIRKGFWSRWMALRYSKKISQCISTKLDVLRTSPQEAVNYMIKNKDLYQPVGLLTRATRP